MPTYETGNNNKYLVHFIAILHLVKQKGTASKAKEASTAFLAVRNEISLLLKFPDDKTVTEKEAGEKKLNDLKEALQAKKDVAVEKAQKAYELFHCFVVGKVQTNWDRIVNEMHTKNPCDGVYGRSNKSLCMHSWISFMGCIKLHKLTIFPANTAEKQQYYMRQTIKKSLQIKVQQFASRMGVLNDYLANLPTVYDLLMAIAGTKKINVPFNEADLAGIVLNAVPSSWVNQYNTMHSMLPKSPRALLNDLEAIERVMD